MLPDKPRYEYRAWDEAFPDLPQPSAEPWEEETYLIPLGMLSRNIKIRDDALEIKEMLADRNGLELWHLSARLEFPIPALTLERELMVLLKIGQPLRHERYGPREIMEDIVAPRRNVVAIPLRKRRHLYEVAGCRAETAEIELQGQRLMTAAAEHEEAERVLEAVQLMGLDRHPNASYPIALTRLLPEAMAGHLHEARGGG
jgi:hypothetical protein